MYEEKMGKFEFYVKIIKTLILVESWFKVVESRLKVVESKFRSFLTKNLLTPLVCDARVYLS